MSSSLHVRSTRKGDTLTSNAVDLVVEHVMQYAKLRPETTRLPNEDAICEAVGVSRGPVREAMKTLEALGVVEIRRGVGTFLRPHGVASLTFAKEFRKALLTAAPEHLYELRLAMEQTAAFYAAERRSLEEIARLREINTRMAEACTGTPVDLDALTRIDVEFHGAIYDAGRNPLLAVLGRFVTEMVSAAIREGHDRVGGEVSVRNHERILASIEDRDAHGAEREVGSGPVLEGLANWKNAIVRR